MNLNFNNPWFKKNFKRNPKMWTLEQIHDLFMRASERSKKRYIIKSKIIKEIVIAIPKNKNNEHIIYYYNEKDSGNIWGYNISYHNEYKSHMVGNNRLKFSDNIIESRNEKIEFLLHNELAFELGEKFHKAYKMCSNMEYRVRGIMWEIMERNIQEYFKKTNTLPKDVFIVDIGSKKYYIKTDSQHRYGYMKFHLGNEYIPDEYIDISNYTITDPWIDGRALFPGL